MSDEGWRELNDARREDGEPVQGLLSNGTVVDAEWWGPLPDGMYSPGQWDGSGWGWDSTLDVGSGAELIAWRPSAIPLVSTGNGAEGEVPGGTR